MCVMYQREKFFTIRKKSETRSMIIHSFSFLISSYFKIFTMPKFFAIYPKNCPNDYQTYPYENRGCRIDPESWKHFRAFSHELLVFSRTQRMCLQIFFRYTFIHYFLYEIGLCFAFFHLKCTETF